MFLILMTVVASVIAQAASCDFFCADGRGCTYNSYVCDGDQDCADLSDEDVDLCKTLPCSTKQEFDCYVTRAKGETKDLCILYFFMCDGAVDCVNGEDEFCNGSCHNTTQFRCDDGSCISSHDRCNGEPDCATGEDESNCLCNVTSEFQCADGSCIPVAQKCDKVRDCVHGEDEAMCTYPCDSALDHQCPDGTCVSPLRICDGTKDCGNGEDEEGCPDRCNVAYGLGDAEFQCADGSCISQNAKCDKNIDCPAGDDEQNCPLVVQLKVEESSDGTNVTLTCSIEGASGEAADYEWLYSWGELWRNIGSGPNITVPKNTEPPAYLYKCIASFPETDSSGESNVVAFPDDDVGMSCEFQCSSGRCLLSREVCNGNRDCADGSDEDVNMCRALPCPYSTDFDCYDTRAKGNVKFLCIPNLLQCDGQEDCANGEDERCVDFCHKTTQFLCDSGWCIERHQRCNGEFDCANKEDERNCPCAITEFQCADGSCIPATQLCDKIRNCAHGEDESTCSYHCKRFLDFECPAGEVNCIPRDKRCDGTDDCPGGEDEIACPLSVHIEMKESVDGSKTVITCFIQEYNALEMIVYWSYSRNFTDEWTVVDYGDEIVIHDVNQMTKGFYRCDALVPRTGSKGSSGIVQVTEKALLDYLSQTNITMNHTLGDVTLGATPVRALCWAALGLTVVTSIIING